MLAGIRHRYFSTFDAPVRARSALERLSLESLDLTEFSQIVHNAFAGPTWFRLLRVLDGEAPNTTHRTLASLADQGVLRLIVTTNFDTLLERAMPRAVVRNALLDDPTQTGAAAVIKLHGSADIPWTTAPPLATRSKSGPKPPPSCPGWAAAGLDRGAASSYGRRRKC